MERLRRIAEHAAAVATASPAAGGSTFVSPSNMKNKMAGGQTDPSAADSDSAAAAAAAHPPMGQVHSKRADGTWETNEIESAWEERPGPSFAELNGRMQPLAPGAAWAPLEVAAADMASLFDGHGSDPIKAVADGTVPAIIIRGALTAEYCAETVELLIAEGLMRDWRVPADEAGFADNGVAAMGNGTDTRIDIGSSLVNHCRGALAAATPSTRGGTAADDTLNREAFLAHSVGTHALFDRLWPPGGREEGPVSAFFRTMNGLSEPAGKRTVVAREPDGRRYGPAIFRVHYESWAYAPHVNH
eukprot:SAG22_NODE_3717_length_1561_cov_0.935021_2_plen_301_part_01